MYRGSKAGSYLRLIDSCIPKLEAHGPSRTGNGSKKGPVSIQQVTYLCQKRTSYVNGGYMYRQVIRGYIMYPDQYRTGHD